MQGRFLGSRFAIRTGGAIRTTLSGLVIAAISCGCDGGGSGGSPPASMVASSLGLAPAAVSGSSFSSDSGGVTVADPATHELAMGGGGVLISTGRAADRGAGSSDLLGDGLPDRTTFSLNLNVPADAIALVYSTSFRTAEHAGPAPDPRMDTATVAFSTGAPTVVLGTVGPAPLPSPVATRSLPLSGAGSVTLEFTVEDAVDGDDDSVLEIHSVGFATAGSVTADALAASLFPGATVLSSSLTASSGPTAIANVEGAAAIPGGALLSTGLAADGGTGSTDLLSDGQPDRTVFTVTLAVPAGARSLAYSSEFVTAEFSGAPPNADEATGEFSNGVAVTLGLVGPLPETIPREIRAVDVNGLSEISLEFTVEDSANGLRDSGLRLTGGFFTESAIASADELAAALFPAGALSASLAAESGALRIVDVLGARPGDLGGSVLLTSGLASDGGLGDHDAGDDAASDSITFSLSLAVPQGEEIRSLVFSSRFLTTELAAATPGSDSGGAEAGSALLSLGSVASSVTAQDPPVTRAFDVEGEAEVTASFSLTDDADAGARDSGLLLYNVYFSEFDADLLNEPRPADAKLQSGTYAWSKSLISAGGPMVPFGFMVHYSSAPRRTSGAVGPRWGHNYDWAVIEVDDGDLLVRRGDGRIETFEPDPVIAGAYVPAHGQVFNRLIANADGSYDYVTTDQLLYRFAHEGHLLSITDPGGNAATLAYADGKLESVTDTRQLTGTFTYDSDDKLTGVAYASLTVTLGYSGDDLVSIIGPDGAETTFTYDGDHNLLTGTDGGGIVFVQNTYDDLHRVTEQLDAKLAPSSTVYDVSTSTHVDRAGNVQITTFDPLDRQVALEDGTGAVWSYGYDEDDNVVSTTDPLGETSFSDYDDSGNLIETVDALAGVASTVYDSANRPVTATDELGATIAFVYDAAGDLSQDFDALGVARTYTYDSRGLRTSRTDRNGNLTQYAYDAEGDLVAVTDALGGMATFEHDDLGREIASYDANGHGVFMTLDAYGRTLETIDALGNVTTQAYDAEGRLVSEANALGETSLFEYSPTGKLVRFEDPLGVATSAEYDGNDQLVSVTDPRGSTTTFSYDAALRLAGTVDPLGGTVTAEYDAAGNRTAVIDPNGARTEFSYDATGLGTSETDPLGNTVTNVFDARGRVTAITNGRGQTIGCSYDAAARLTAIHRSDHDVLFTLDGNGNRLVTAGKDGCTTTRTFDALNRLSSVTDVHGNTIGYQYDAVGNIIALVYSDGSTATYTYDALDRMTSVTDWAGRTTTYTYDAVGKLIAAELPDSSVVGYVYDAAGRLLSITDTAPGGATTFRSTYTLDAAGLRIAEDAELPLEAPITGGTRTFQFDAANQLVAEGADVFTYDADGNMVHGVIGRLPVDLAYDEVGRLVSVGAGTYEYDDEGMRIGATIDYQTVRYVSDANGASPRVLEEHDEDGDVIARYVYGLGLVSRHEFDGHPGQAGGDDDDFALDGDDDDDGPDESASVYHFDSRGSTVALTDLDGDVTDRYAYDPYGLVVAREGDSRNPFTFGGRHGVVDDGNGLYFMRARYYEPRLMRFITRDRLVFGALEDTQSLNRYVYARGNPIHGIDPDGQWFGLDDAVMMIGGAIANVAGQFVSDVISGEWSTWEDYVGAAVGGAVWGETFLYTGNPWLAGAAGAAAGNATAQGLKIATGKQDRFDFGELLIETAIGGLLGGILPGGPAATGFKKGGSVFTLRMTARALTRNAGTNLAYATKQQFNRLAKKIILESIGSGVVEGVVKGVAGRFGVDTEAIQGVITDSALFLWYGPATTTGGGTP